ncbi:hypothetical protein SAMN05216464_10353 [Mucilaginibacter pineti]|uniref:Uncharacterized protein n=1 Tax=Mucilaginibacter pineti TaxID=1391627 RepID=A0A1G6YPY2_9SPHI|nr:hypothetical protein [Mucilaginibacter pineti]SDD92371.1 hypothetical protein SAMN05216464_10353 [Mucilaginibacter pineti]
MKEDEKDKTPQMIIAGTNLLVLIAYTIYFHTQKDELIIIGEAFLIVIQIIICLVTAIFVYRKEFLLSAALVLLIGFSTCWVVFTQYN